MVTSSDLQEAPMDALIVFVAIVIAFAALAAVSFARGVDSRVHEPARWI